MGENRRDPGDARSPSEPSLASRHQAIERDLRERLVRALNRAVSYKTSLAERPRAEKSHPDEPGPYRLVPAGDAHDTQWRRPTAAKPMDIWLAIISVVVAIVLFLVPKTAIVVVICIAVIGALLIHPVWNFWWIDRSRPRQIVAVCFLIVASVWLGRVSWPLTVTELPTGKLSFQVDNFQVWSEPGTWKILANVTITNNGGDATITDYTNVAFVPSKPSDLGWVKHARSVQRTVAELARHGTGNPPTRILHRQTLWFTPVQMHVTQKQFAAFRRGEYGLYFAGIIIVHRLSGSETVRYCAVNFGDPGVIALCPI